MVAPLTGDQPPARVVLLCAGAGSGKTSLLSSCTDLFDYSAWVTLDRYDNDPHLLWSAVLTALSSSGAWPEDSGFHRLAPPGRRLDSHFLTRFVSAFDDIDRPLWLIMDDVHELNRRAAVESIDTLLHNVPDNLRLVLSARHDPPMPTLARLRLDGRLLEVRQDGFAFDRAEALALLADHDLELSHDDLTLLLDTTDGWAAGLRLAALVLDRAADPHAVVVSFSGDERAVGDYLAGAVLANLSSGHREFLLRTSICADITPDLAASLTGRPDAGAVLEELSRMNALTMRIIDTDRRYRYHTLLRGYLRTELGRADPGAVGRQHAIASSWFAAAGEHVLAIEHAIASDDRDRLVEVLRHQGLELVLSGQGTKLRALCDGLGEPMLAVPEVALLAACAALDADDLTDADAHLARIQQPTEPRLATFYAAVVLWRASRGSLHGEHVEALVGRQIDELIASADQLPDDALTALVLAHRGTARTWLDELDAAEADLRRALDLAVRHPRLGWLALRCLEGLMGVAAGRADFPALAHLAADALTIAQTPDGTLAPHTTSAHTSLAWVAYQRNDLVAAGTHIGDAIAGATAHLPVGLDLAMCGLAHLLDFDQGGDRYAAVRSLRELWDRLDARWAPPGIVALLTPAMLRTTLAIGQLGWAAEVTERCANLLGEGGEHALSGAALDIARGRTRSGRARLQPVLDGTLACASVATMIDALLLDAALASRVEPTASSHDQMTRALQLAEPREMLRPFIDGSEPIRLLLARGRGGFGPHERFVTRVLGHFESPALTMDGRHERLTAAELGVLAHLPTLRTLGEIADEQFVSVNTIKTHLRGIYQKLGVHSRREAVDHARRRGLLQ